MCPILLKANDNSSYKLLKWSPGDKKKKKQKHWDEASHWTIELYLKGRQLNSGFAKYDAIGEKVFFLLLNEQVST